MLHGGRHALEVLNWAKADIEVEQLAQGYIQRANAAADGSGERSFDPDQKFLKAFNRIVGQPIVEALFGGFACVDFEPGDFAAATIGLVHGGFEDSLAG